MRSTVRLITIGLVATLAACLGGEGSDGPEALELVVTPYGGCADLSDGTTRCWGRHPWEDGVDLGTVPVTFDAPAHEELALSNAGLGSLHCAVDAGGAVTCGGSVVRSKHIGTGLGDYPTPVTGAPGLGRLAVSETGACGLSSVGAAWCWGSWDGGLRGTGSAVPDTVPFPSMAATAVAGGLVFEEVVRGRDAACGRTAAGAVHCWGGWPMVGGELAGLDSGSACGNAWSTRCANAPRAVTLPGPAVEISAGLYHVCAVLTSGAVSCWGDGFNGALGQGDEVDHHLPVTVPGVTGMAHIAAGMFLTCAGSGSGALICWGTGTSTEPQSPSSWATDHPFVRIAAGYEHVCGRTAANEVECWGNGLYGALGVGDTLPRTSPTRVSF